ncbi:MAG: DUF120 domain-containing protein [Candidatus Odinarchaeia archaeon]
MESDLWFSLLGIAELKRKSEIISTIKLAKHLEISQQTASRRVQELEKKGWITRQVTRKGQFIEITSSGWEVLSRVYFSLRTIFNGEIPKFEISGEVFSGFGEGAYYVSREGYLKQFKEKLGFIPYPGTLNLKLKTTRDIQTRMILEALPGVVIKGFKSEGRTFGPVKCHHAYIQNGVKCAILLINRTHYKNDVLEIIAPENLRKKLNLNDGDIIKVEIVPER